jgi:hypothetical protein
MTTGAAAFRLPHDGLTYTEEVLERCRGLISSGIWAGVHVVRLNGWVKNFRTDEERYFAACVLDNLIYRSEQQTVSLIRQLLQRTLADLTRQDPTPLGPVDDWLALLRKDPWGINPRLRLVAVVQRNDPPTKSAYVIARLMKRYLRVDERWIITPWGVEESVRKGTQVFIYIDDFLGTGDQFSKVVEAERLQPLFNASYNAYAPLAAHSRGVNSVENSYPDLRLAPVETLTERYSLFSADSSTFDDGVNAPATAEEFYYKLLDTRGIALYGSNRRGFGGLELAYAFSHAVPDNCIPILWYSHAADWQPLFDR